MVKSLGPYVDSEVERLTSNIVNKTIREKMNKKNIKSFLIENTSIASNQPNIFYNVEKINSLKSEITDSIQNTLTSLDEANINDYHLFNQLHTGKYAKIKKGILAENSINSLRGSTILGNLGPSVPVRLFFVGQVQSNIEIETKEYGINNLLIEIYLTISVKEQIMMPLSSKIKTITLKELLGADIVRGTIPNYYSGFSK